MCPFNCFVRRGPKGPYSQKTIFFLLLRAYECESSTAKQLGLVTIKQNNAPFELECEFAVILAF